MIGAGTTAVAVLIHGTQGHIQGEAADTREDTRLRNFAVGL